MVGDACPVHAVAAFTMRAISCRSVKLGAYDDDDDDVGTGPIMFNSKTIKEHTMLIVPNDTDLQKATEEIQANGAAATASSASGPKK